MGFTGRFLNTFLPSVARGFCWVRLHRTNALAAEEPGSVPGYLHSGRTSRETQFHADHFHEATFARANKKTQLQYHPNTFSPRLKTRGGKNRAEPLSHRYKNPRAKNFAKNHVEDRRFFLNPQLYFRTWRFAKWGNQRLSPQPIQTQNLVFQYHASEFRRSSPRWVNLGVHAFWKDRRLANSVQRISFWVFCRSPKAKIAKRDKQVRKYYSIGLLVRQSSSWIAAPTWIDWRNCTVEGFWVLITPCSEFLMVCLMILSWFLIFSLKFIRVVSRKVEL